MRVEEVGSAVSNLQRLARMVFAAFQKKTWVKWSVWAGKNEKELNDLLGYERGMGMPAISSLVRPHFHPRFPLVGFNYTPAAHNILYRFPSGWTPAIRLCRGIIFDKDGNLVALPFPKFFNLNEHPETNLDALPHDEPFEATNKLDGHLGIVYRYDGRMYVATRGSFVSKSAAIGTRILNGSPPQDLPKNITPLVEIIHPKTFVYIDYGQVSRLILIGAYSLETHEDFDYKALAKLGLITGWRVASIERGTGGKSFDELTKWMKDLTVSEKEGLVIRFESGLRVKLKFRSYINLMVEAKLGYKYLMQRFLAGNLWKMISELPEEILSDTMRMWGEITMVLNVSDDLKERRRYLYVLVSEDESTNYYRMICRRFLEKLQGKEKEG